MTVTLTLAERPSALIVPEDAIDPVASKVFVFVIRNGRAIRQEVKLGTRLQGEVEVMSGVTVGEPVVVRGLQRLRHDVPVQIVETLRPTA
jgi:membrane fusion protein (multidrug efflux system)